jgi:hypothetical protein
VGSKYKGAFLHTFIVIVNINLVEPCLTTDFILQDHSNCKKIRDGLLEYLDEMDMMFSRNTVDGSMAFCAGQPNSFVVDAESSDEQPVVDPDYQVTPPSAGTKRTTNTNTTASSPNKKCKSPTVRLMDTNM